VTFHQLGAVFHLPIRRYRGLTVQAFPGFYSRTLPTAITPAVVGSPDQTTRLTAGLPAPARGPAAGTPRSTAAAPNAPAAHQSQLPSKTPNTPEILSCKARTLVLDGDGENQISLSTPYVCDWHVFNEAKWNLNTYAVWLCPLSTRKKLTPKDRVSFDFALRQEPFDEEHRIRLGVRQGNIYDIDCPNCACWGQESVEVYHHFRQCINWDGERCSEHTYWYYFARWKRDQSPQITLNELGEASKKEDLPDLPDEDEAYYR